VPQRLDCARCCNQARAEAHDACVQGVEAGGGSAARASRARALLPCFAHTAGPLGRQPGMRRCSKNDSTAVAGLQAHSETHHHTPCASLSAHRPARHICCGCAHAAVA
jgi:hypothetical protein